MRRAATLLAGAIATFVALGMLAGIAQANSYDVYACYAGQGTYLNPGHSAVSWALSDNNGSNYYFPFDQCGGSTNGFGIISRSGYFAPPGDYGQVSFTAPAGLRIRQVQLWRSMYDYGLGSGGTSQRNYAMNFADGILPSAGDEYDGSFDVPHGAAGSGDRTNNGIVPSNYISVNLAAALPRTYAYVIGCGFSNGCPTGGQDPASPSGWDTAISIYGAIVSIEDDTAPTLSLSNTGLLNGQTQSATVPLTLNASAIAGIEKIAVYADSNNTPLAVDDFTQTSHCAFYLAVPCQNLSAFQLPIDTTQLSDGNHYITVKAYDPAGNVAAISSANPVNTHNAPTASGQPLISGSAQVGQPLSGADTSFNSPNGAGAMTVTHQFVRCDAQGNNCQPIPGASASTYTLTAADSGTTIRFRDVAHNSDGQSVVDSVPTQVVSPPANSGSSGSGGAGSGGVGSAGPSGSNGANGLNGTDGSVTITITPGQKTILGSTARWRATLSVSPTHVHRRTLIHLSGRVLTSPRPSQGKLIYLQARTIRHVKAHGKRRTRYGAWLTFRVLRTNAAGRFSSNYRFRLGHRHIYQFQAVAPKEGGYRNPTGTSEPVTITET